MKPYKAKWAFLGLLFAGLFLIQKASATTVTATTSDDGFPAHLVTWTDSSGNTRQAMMIDQNSSGGGPYPGYLRQYTYQYNGSPRICTGFYSAADGYPSLLEFSGDGFVQNHTAADNDFSSGNSPGQQGTTTVTNFGSHVIIEYDMPNYEIDGPYYNPVYHSVPTTIQWFFADGRDHPIFAISQDASQTGGNLGADSRSPYGDMCYDGYESYYGFTDGGCGSDGYLANVGGVSYGDTYKFVTPDGGYITLNSSWEDTVPNTIPYAMQWAQDDNTDGATPVDAEWGHVATLPGSVYDQGEDPTSDPSTDPRDNTGTSMIPDTTWAYQIMAYLWPSENGGSISDPTEEKKVTWGRNYGSVGGFDNYGDGGNDDPLKYYPHWTDPKGDQYEGTPRVDGSIMAYSVFDVFGPHGTPSSTAYQTGAVGQVVTQMENVALSTLSASTGTVKTTGPAGVGNTTAALAKTITYSPAGYNPTYSAWEITAANNAVNATLTPETGKPLATPLFIIDNYTLSVLPVSITVNGSSSGYYASLDTHNQRLFITASASASSGTPLNLIVSQAEAPAPSISSLSIDAATVGTTITITGQHFTGTTPVDYTVTAITFAGGVSASIANVTSTSVQTVVPAGAITGPITVTTTGGGSANSTSFSPLYTLSLSSSPSADGTVTAPGLASGEVESASIAGGQVTLTATANTGYLFSDWTLGGASVSTSASYDILLHSNVTYVANFLTAYTLTVNNLTPAFGSVSGGGIFAAGSTPTITATPNSGYVFSNWTEGVTVESTSPSYNVTLNANVTIDATFALIPPPLLGVLNGATIITNNNASTVRFGTVEQNSKGPIVTFTVTNSGGETLDLTTPTLPMGYTLLTNLPATVAPGASGSFTVQLNSAVAGTNSGNITITNNDNNIANSTFRFPITGVVYNDIISLTGNLAFGGVAIGSSAQSTLTISNLGNTNLVVSNITYPAGFAANWTNGTIAPGASQAVTVTFSPVIASNYSGSVMIISDSSSGIGDAPISGYGANGSLVLTVLKSGEGAVVPDLNGQTLVAGTKHTIRAVPTTGSGYIFAGWTGSTNSFKNPLTFTMETSTLLEANFVPNPFPAFAGAYNGIFVATNGVVTEETAGMLKGLTLNSKGAYSATLLINGESKGFTGTFDANGQTTNIITRPATLGDLQVVLTLTSNYPAPQIIGTVSGTNQGAGWVADLVADRATNTVASGEFTMLIPPDAANSPPDGSPGGDGYALITNYAGTGKNPASANAKIAGALADGTVFSQTVPVSQDGFAPIYASLYSGKGLLLGNVNLEMTNTSGVSLTWIHPTLTKSLYRSGFTNILLTNQILLSPWTNTPADIALPTEVSLYDTIYDSNALTSIAITTTGKGAISGPSVKGTINPKTGMVTTTLGSGKSKVTAYGAILLNNGTNSGGYYLTETNAQAFEIGP